MIKGAGTNSKPLKYAYSDLRPYNGIAYYRLKQTDTDGGYKYYRHAAVSCSTRDESLGIYPNPNNGNFVVEGLDEGSDLVISNALEQIVATVKTTAVKQEIDLSTLPGGIYFIKAAAGRHPLPASSSLRIDLYLPFGAGVSMTGFSYPAFLTRLAFPGL